MGAAGYIAYDLVSDRENEPKATEQTDGMPVGTPSAKPTPVKPRPSATKPVVKPTAKPTVKPTVKPTTPKPPPLPVSKPAQAAALAKTFVTHLNANRPEAAGALACAEAKDFVPALIGNLVAPPTQLTVGRATQAPNIVVFQLSGRTKGKAASGVVLIEIVGSPCVKVVQVTTFG
ncbi:hypothetical protein ACQPXM_40945 [Kribbella sp. CA-253562]|uniref:hypothetical protein n=1 Tax=Kribbella sp. CA-253562 TaxID=3239942 RepID=UPI003D9129A4